MSSSTDKHMLFICASNQLKTLDLHQKFNASNAYAYVLKCEKLINISDYIHVLRMPGQYNRERQGLLVAEPYGTRNKCQPLQSVHQSTTVGVSFLLLSVLYR